MKDLSDFNPFDDHVNSARCLGWWLFSLWPLTGRSRSLGLWNHHFFGRLTLSLAFSGKRWCVYYHHFMQSSQPSMKSLQELSRLVQLCVKCISLSPERDDSLLLLRKVFEVCQWGKGVDECCEMARNRLNVWNPFLEIDLRLGILLLGHSQVIWAESETVTEVAFKYSVPGIWQRAPESFSILRTNAVSVWLDSVSFTCSWSEVNKSAMLDSCQKQNNNYTTFNQRSRNKRLLCLVEKHENVSSGLTIVDGLVFFSVNPNEGLLSNLEVQQVIEWFLRECDFCQILKEKKADQRETTSAQPSEKRVCFVVHQELLIGWS